MEKTSVRNTILLGSLSIGTWTGRKTATAQARKIEADHKAKTGTMSATKHLFAGVELLEKINKNATATRVEWGKRSVPWYDSGPRAFNSLSHKDIMEWVRGRRGEFRTLVDAFLPQYAALREGRKYELQDLFDEKDFPRPSDMPDKFYFRFSTDTVSNSDDIRVLEGIDEADVDKMIQRAEQRVEARVQAGVAHAAQQLYEVVNHMHSRLRVGPKDSGGEFRDSLIENIAALVPIMPTLNISNDPELAKLCAQAQKLALYSPDELRANMETRAKAASQSKSLAKKLSSLFDGGDE